MSDTNRTSNQKLPLLEWVLERFENCCRIARQKEEPADRDSWMEDAEYFRQILVVLSGKQPSGRQPVETTQNLLPTPSSQSKRDGSWIDKWGACKLCDGEIPDGHTAACDLWKLEQEVASLRIRASSARQGSSVEPKPPQSWPNDISRAGFNELGIVSTKSGAEKASAHIVGDRCSNWPCQLLRFHDGPCSTTENGKGDV